MTQSLKDDVPDYSDLINPVLSALQLLGGSGTVDEIRNQVIKSFEIPDAIARVPHDREVSNLTELEHQLARARSYLRRAGLVKNSSSDVWVLKPEHRSIEKVDADEVIDRARNRYPSGEDNVSENLIHANEDTPSENGSSWKAKLRRVLTQELEADSFERLTQRLLRELGFREVEVTDRSGDGGIDGRGLLKVNGILSFHIVFQCKRYTGTVSTGEIRDFRGAMAGRADRGLFLTTGNFSREASNEATRDGAVPIDLVDGDDLATKLKNLSLGVETRVIERVVVNEEWFSKI